MTRRIYIKGIRNETNDDNRLVLAYLLLARALVEREERENEGEQRGDREKPDTSEPAA